jgi:hypothetical protein
MGLSALLSTQILDSSATGRSVLTGADAASIRTVLGLGTTNSPQFGGVSFQTVDAGVFRIYGDSLTSWAIRSNALGHQIRFDVASGWTEIDTAGGRLKLGDTNGVYDGTGITIDGGDNSIYASGNVTCDEFYGLNLWPSGANTTLVCQGNFSINSGACSITQAWNNGSTLFDSLSVNVTDTSSDANSNLLNLKISGASRFKVGKSGSITASGSLTLTTGTITASTPAWSATQTWNNAATTFTGLLLNVTNTASNANSLFADFQVGGVSQFRVDRTGTGYFAGDIIQSTGGFTHRLNGNNSALSIVGAADINNGASIQLRGNSIGSNNGTVIFRRGTGSSTVDTLTIDGTTSAATFAGNIIAPSVALGSDTILLRDAANTLGQRNGTSAQRFNIYGTYTDASNYRRLYLTQTTAGAATIGVEGLGTGASGNTLTIGNPFTVNGNLTLSTFNLVTDTTTGTRIGTGNTQKLGFWNATPLVQPTTGGASATVVGGTGTTVKQDDTFDGYSIQQVVKALRNIGILA